MADNAVADQENATPTPPAPTAKKKPERGPNEASLGSWVLFLICSIAAWQAVTLVLGIAFRIAFGAPTAENGWYTQMLPTLISFAIGLFLTCKFLRVFIKTSAKDFCFGAGNKPNVRHIALFAIAQIIGLVVITVPEIALGRVELNPIGVAPIIINAIICLLLIWAQTSLEEFLFRGAFLRFACGNKLEITVKSVLCGVFSSALFMIGHLTNPEMLAQGDYLSYITGALAYFVPGFAMYFMALLYGNLLPGLAVHWANNFFLGVVVSQSGGALNSASIFLDHAPLSNSGVTALLSTIGVYLLPFLLGLYYYHKRKKNNTELPE